MDPTAPHLAVRCMANYYKQKQKLRLNLSASEAKASTEQSVEPEELAHEIIGKWLARRTKK